MLEFLRHLVAPRPMLQWLADFGDLMLVTYVTYRVLLVLRGTRAMQMVTGLAVVFLVFIGSRFLGLVTMYNLLSSILASAILIVVVVFQNDIRRGLMRVGAPAFFGGLSRQQESRVIEEVVAAATELARHRIGALICFEDNANLDEFVVAQGTNIDAAVERDLLVSLFIPEAINKLHDGAVIIRNLRIARAGVFFPMPEARVDKSLGSRHRAALGVTEETDAVVVVVSEERGTIGFCFNGNIVSNLDGPSLRQALNGLFGHRKKSAKSDKKALATPGRASLPPPPYLPKDMPPQSRRVERDEDEPLSTRGTVPRTPQKVIGEETRPEIRPSVVPKPMPKAAPIPPRGPSERSEDDG